MKPRVSDLVTAIFYNYNIRGWLKTINDVNTIGNDLFAFKINYNTPETATPLFNGNISETFWKTSSDNIKRKYDYSYDHLNRLLQADYSKEGNTTFNSYLEQLTYDKNGNIQSLVRNGNMDTDGMQFENPIDNLTYLYDDTNKNQLLRVFDATSNTQGFKDDTDGTDINHDISEAPDYAYDANGNMNEDKNKGIESIVYNHLNLPVEIVFPTGKITYLYNAVGQKVRKTVEETGITTTTDYLSGFQYKNAVLQFFPHAEGYVNASENATKGGGTSYTFNYVFNFTDHLGNIRLSYSKDPVTNVLKIIEENHYYPFGLKHSGYNSDKMMYSKEGSTVKIKPVPPLFVTSYSKKYNGYELEEELGKNTYAYGWRDYDPALGRFNKMDRFSEKYTSLSPYGYAGNNPILINDIQGDSLWISLGKNEKVLYENGNLLSKGSDGKFSEYKGDQAKIDKKTGAIKGYKGFLGQVVSALNTLSSKCVGYDLVTSIQQSTSNLSIEKSTDNGYDPNSKTVLFNPNSGYGDINSRGSTSRPSFIGLGHEMAHGLDDINGTLNTSLVPGYSSIREGEKFATHIENQLRNEHNLPLRTHYRVLNSEGGVIESMPLLNGAIKSSHYPNFYYGGFNSVISPAPVVINNAQIVPSVFINIQK